VILEHDWFPRPLPANVVIGSGSWCYSSFAFIHYQSRRPCGVRIGHDSGIYNGTFFDLGPEGEVDIGDFCSLVGAIICTNSRVTIGDYSFLAHEVVIADHPAMVPPHHPARAVIEPKTGAGITIGTGSWIGARAILLGGATIGEGAIVGAGAVVDGLVPPYTIAAGNPIRIIQRRPDARG
jgi:acetyltransferase-like isoleucine patch superfamily enzyme